LAAIASLRSTLPAEGVYLVNPLSIAILASSFINRGVSKSGSPPAKFTTSLPSFISFFVKVVIFKVADLLSEVTCGFIIAPPL